ncbi:hypothetical protein [Psychrobacter sp. LV10R520-6]|uniref:hypothetical protein n=1 Tax=Psychrobacter sp. LV10R520-6 TaxID=1415574 RepID=UPI0024CA1BE3|nr:hypothetical protein [Psychrobacter sp. LV10R520-6]SNT69268.1 hypothetical protein SAMN04488491_0340 [Psychrobacter sp. LV10R520-6]
MNNLYIVESPLQVLCALEVSLGKKDEVHNIIVRTSGGVNIRNDDQILNLVNKFSWNSKTIINNKPNPGRYSIHFENKSLLADIANKYKGKIKNLYIGEFRSSFMHMARVAVEAPNVTLLDDGAVSVRIINNYINKGCYCPFSSFCPENKFKKLVYKLIYRKYINTDILNKRINVLTAFSNQESNNIEKLVFSNIKKLLKKERYIDSSLVYYYGSKYSEVGIISQDYELLFLKRIKNFYDFKNKKIIYFAHREESEEKLDLFSKELDIKVITSGTMAELYLLESKVLPVEISGAYTSILNNVKVIFPEISLRSFKLKPEQVGYKWRKDIGLVYDYYQKLNIPIEE